MTLSLLKASLAGLGSGFMGFQRRRAVVSGYSTESEHKLFERDRVEVRDRCELILVGRCAVAGWIFYPSFCVIYRVVHQVLHFIFVGLKLKDALSV